MGRHHEARAIARRMLRQAARASASRPAGTEMRFQTPLVDCFLRVSEQSLLLSTIPRAPFVRSLTLKTPILLDAPGLDPELPDHRTKAIIDVADAIDDMRPTEHRPQSPSLIAIRHAFDCMHLAPGGRLVVTAPCLTRPGDATLSNRMVPPTAVMEAAMACASYLMVHVDHENRGGIMGGRGGHLLIDLRPVEGVAEIPRDPVAILRTMARAADGGDEVVAGIHGGSLKNPGR